MPAKPNIRIKINTAGLPPAVLILVIHVSIRPPAYSTRTA